MLISIPYAAVIPELNTAGNDNPPCSHSSSYGGMDVKGNAKLTADWPLNRLIQISIDFNMYHKNNSLFLIVLAKTCVLLVWLHMLDAILPQEHSMEKDLQSPTLLKK